MYIATPLSKHIAGYEYNKQTKILVITFNPKLHKYQYEDVPAKVIKGLEDAPSKSLYFNKNIKTKYKTTRIL